MFPGTNPPTDPNAQGMENIAGKEVAVYYVLKAGCTPNLYDLEHDWGTSVDDKTVLAEVHSSDDEDADIAASLKGCAASDSLMAKTKDIRAMAVAAMQALSGVAPKVKTEVQQDSDESDAEPMNMFASAMRTSSSSASACSSKAPSTSTKPGSTTTTSRPSPSAVSSPLQMSPVKKDQDDCSSPPAPIATSAPAAGVAVPSVPALWQGSSGADDGPAASRRGRPRMVVSVADGLTKLFQDFLNSFSF